MLVGTKNIDTREVLKNQHNLDKYILSCIPEILKGNDKILQNQKWITAIYLRNDKTIPYATRQRISKELLADANIFGDISELVDISDVLRSTDMDDLFRRVFCKEI